MGGGFIGWWMGKLRQWAAGEGPPVRALGVLRGLCREAWEAGHVAGVEVGREVHLDVGRELRERIAKAHEERVKFGVELAERLRNGTRFHGGDL